VKPGSIFVHIDVGGATRRVGTLWTHPARSARRTAAATFEYAPEWLSDPLHFSLEPALAIGRGTFQTVAGRALFGAFGDSAPDRWGRRLMDRAAAQRARETGAAGARLTEADYLLGVADESRSGALRFATAREGPFLAPPTDSDVPPLVELPALLQASDEIVQSDGSGSALRLLLAPGSSLGGARPKASVRDSDGQLAIAKFPSQTDDLSNVLWESVALTLAERAGLRVERHRVVDVASRPVLVVQRFDRIGNRRVPFLSAMSMLSAHDNESHSYMEIADAIRQHGSAAGEDLRELWRRIVFTILISNTDDHLRNHGFLYDDIRRGWRLAPLYDVNPTPRSVKPGILTLAIDESNTTADLNVALGVAEYFDIEKEDSHDIAAEVRDAVDGWADRARDAGLRAREIDAMKSAFMPSAAG
jgi:serine/threonine-protein kinase HipA